MIDASIHFGWRRKRLPGHTCPLRHRRGFSPLYVNVTAGSRFSYFSVCSGFGRCESSWRSRPFRRIVFCLMKSVVVTISSFSPSGTSEPGSSSIVRKRSKQSVFDGTPPRSLPQPSTGSIATPSLHSRRKRAPATALTSPMFPLTFFAPFFRRVSLSIWFNRFVAAREKQWKASRPSRA